MPHDVFISYARRDNTHGRVSELVERIADDYRQLSRKQLRYFFDVHDIPGMDDWLYTILEGLKESQLFVLVLSPAYLKSENCEWEIVEYLKYESARAVSGEGVAPIYVVTIPDLDEPGFEERAAAWFARVRRRQHFDLRAWFDAGRQALESQDVRTRLDDLKSSLHTRLSRLGRIAEAAGNLPAHNPRFVGRETEMSRLHEAAGLGQLGVISVLHGIGGLGKTALAIQYAYAYADFYPGGRWLVLASSRHDLAAAIRTLDVDLKVEFTDAEKLDDTRAAKRILQNLHERAERGATARAGEPNPPQPRTLLILDNIDDARLLQPPHTDLLSGCSWLHVLATTRLGPEQLSPDDPRHCLLPVDELPEDDALRLIASYQPQDRFASDDERAAAREIVTLLQSFTLAVEVVAVHLAERGGRLTCAALRDRLKAEGLTGLENVAGTTTRGIPHVERLVTVTLAPTLATLAPPESLVLVLAALLPPDHVPLPWLRVVAAATFPDLGQDAPPGYDDPWLSLVNHLISLRLLQVVELAADGRTPRLCRVHRLVQEVVKKTQPDDQATRERALLDHIRDRAGFLWDGWVQHEHRWELAPLTACADRWLERDGDNGPLLATAVAGPLRGLGNFAAAERLNRRAVERTRPDNPNYATCLTGLALLLQDTNRMAEAEPMCRQALAIDEASYGPDHPSVARALNNLASLLQDTRRLAEAEPLHRRALAILERSYGPGHPDVAHALNNLASLLQVTNHLAEAEPLYRRALAIHEASYGRDHPDVARDLNNLAGLLYATNRLAEAEPLYRRALAIWEKSLGKDHPQVATAVNNLALLLQATNRLIEAEPLYRRALAIDEASYGRDHPSVARALNNLAFLLQATDRLTEAEPLYRRALAIHEASYGRDHPDVATALNNLAELLRATNRLAEAEPLYRRALAIHEASYGRDHPDVATALNNLAELLRATNRLAEAEPLYRRALAIHEASYGPDHPDVATALNNLAELLRATNRLAEAESLYKRALAICEKSLGKDHPQVATALNNLAELLRATNRLAEAEPQYRRALAIWEKSLGKDHPQVATALVGLAALLYATNRLAEAEPLLRRALAIMEKSYGPDHPNAVGALGGLALLLQATNRLAEAEPMCRRALAIWEKSLGKDHPQVATALVGLAALLYATNRLAEAEPLLRRALAIMEKSYGPDHPNVVGALGGLALLLWATNRMAEAETMFRRAVAILLRFNRATGHEHPDLRLTINTYAGLLAAMGRSQVEIKARLEEMERRFGVSLLRGAYSGQEPRPGGSVLGALGGSPASCSGGEMAREDAGARTGEGEVRRRPVWADRPPVTPPRRMPGDRIYLEIGPGPRRQLTPPWNGRNERGTPEGPSPSESDRMTIPRPRVPIRFESVEKMLNGNDLKSLIVPVEEGLRKFDHLHDEMASSLCGAFLVLRGETGSGKTTLLHTLGLFRKGVQTVSVRRDEPIREGLQALGPGEGAMRVVVIESREALGDTSDVEIESAILAINAFVRATAGERTVVVWPCNSEPIADKLVAAARQIGGEALLGVEEPVFRYSGPARSEYLKIARQTVATFNYGASLADLGISEERAEALAGQAGTIGAFLKLLQVEERKNREILASKLEAQEQCRMWVVVVARNDPEADVGVLTRGQYSTADIDRLMAATDANIVKEMKEHPERLGLLGTAFDAKILYLPALTAIEVIHEYADDLLRVELAKSGFAVGGATNGRDRLLDSELASALQGVPVGTLKRGPKPKAERLAPFDALMAVAKTNDIALNKALGQALVVCGLIERFEQEIDLGGGLTRKSDLVCNAHLDPVRLEMMWRSDTTRSEIANYVLTKLFNYGHAIGFL